jgi:hypothetical protein
MIEFIEFMQERNNYLIRFHNLNKEQIVAIKQRNIDGIDAFYEKRQAILDVIDVLDEKIQVSVQQHSTITVEQKAIASKEILFRDELIHDILKQDLEVISLIEQEKQYLFEEMNQLKKSRKAVSAYSSKSRKSSYDKEL